MSATVTPSIRSETAVWATAAARRLAQEPAQDDQYSPPRSPRSTRKIPKPMRM